MKRLFLCLLMLCAVPATALAQAIRLDKLKVEVKRIEVDGQRMYEVDASGSVQAPPASVWKTLTTYERMHEFVPDLSSCRVLSRNGNEVIIELEHPRVGAVVDPAKGVKHRTAEPFLYHWREPVVDGHALGHYVREIEITEATLYHIREFGLPLVSQILLRELHLVTWNIEAEAFGTLNGGSPFSCVIA